MENLIELKNDLLFYTWYKTEITELSQLRDILVKIQSNRYDYMTLDTETTGTHIILDKPFCITFTLVNRATKVGLAYALHISDKPEIFITYLQQIINNTKLIVLWNAKFDAHMLANIGIDLFKAKKITDGMIFARLATAALTPAEGGPQLGLKAFAKSI